MRWAIALAVLASPATAWEFSASPVCTLTHVEAASEVVVTFDPGNGQYQIDLTLPEPWPNAPFFNMLFVGAQQIQIGTDRHFLSDDDRTLSVQDSGFGNVLDGLELNSRAAAQSGDRVIEFSLEGAAGPVQAFRACEDVLTS